MKIIPLSFALSDSLSLSLARSLYFSLNLSLSLSRSLALSRSLSLTLFLFPLSLSLSLTLSLSVSFSFSLSLSQIIFGDGHVFLEHAWPLMEFMPLPAPHSKLALQASHRLNRRAVSCADDVRVRNYTAPNNPIACN